MGRPPSVTRWRSVASAVAQPDITCAAQQALGFLLGAAHLLDRVIDDLDGMELVEGDGGIRQVLGDTLDEGRAHIDADLADRLRGTAMRDEITGEGGYGVGILALGCEPTQAGMLTNKVT